jgi:hypothetical protein
VLLQNMTGLRELRLLADNTMRPAAGLTQLTKLHLMAHGTTSKLCQVVRSNINLQDLVLFNTEAEKLHSSAGLQGLLTTCSQLRALDLRGNIDQPGNDVILQHGSHLTALSVHRVQATQSRISKDSNLKVLK